MGEHTHEIRVVPILRAWPFGAQPFQVTLDPGETIVGVETVHPADSPPTGIRVFIADEVRKP